jgi:Fe-Mn family superoxide dismutase
MPETPACATKIARRDALTMLGGAGVAVLATGSALAQDGKPAGDAPGAGAVAGGQGAGAHDFVAAMGWDPAKGEYALPKLPYATNALEPHIDAQTMEIHHGKHHQAYVTGLNKALAELKKARDASDFALVKHWSRELAFHGGGHINHCLFWMTMAPAGQGGGGDPTGKLAQAIVRDFGSVETFRKHFEAAAVQVEGAGWGWLVYDHIAKRLMVQQMERQQDLLVTAVTPLLGVDVWEHAYYLKYQNKRADYVKAWWNVVNWSAVGTMFEHSAG